MKKNIIILLIGSLTSAILASTNLHAENTPAPKMIPVVTRLVKIYGEEEKKLQDAILHGDKKAIHHFIANNFEQRTGKNPGEPIGRDAFINTALKLRDTTTHQITQIAAREVSNATILSFKRGNSFIIDVWSNDEENPQLLARYSSEVPAA